MTGFFSSNMAWIAGSDDMMTTRMQWGAHSECVRCRRGGRSAIRPEWMQVGLELELREPASDEYGVDLTQVVNVVQRIRVEDDQVRHPARAKGASLSFQAERLGTAD